MAATKVAEYEGGSEPHSDFIVIQQETLTDGSHTYNVLVNQPDGSQFRLMAVSEGDAWEVADTIQNMVTGIVCTRDAAPVLSQPAASSEAER